MILGGIQQIEQKILTSCWDNQNSSSHNSFKSTKTEFRNRFDKSTQNDPKIKII
jgi:hypothetical protein